MPYLEDSGVPQNGGPVALDLVSLLRERANRQAQATAYLFLKNGETEQTRLSFADLDRRARAIAARLQGLAPAGARALLAYPSGLDFIEAFFACLYAGIVAVPVHLPSRRQAARLAAVFADAAPDLILGLSENSEVWQGEAYRSARWVATDLLGDSAADSWIPPRLTPETLAFLQYTSGSTGDPKGVMVSHGNLWANQEAIRRGFGHTGRSTVVGWLPLHHDMGLIGNVLQPLYLGSLAVLMPPLAFLEKPVRWLQAISKYRAATSGGPNFAYDLCVRKISEEDRRGLDLSCWELAFNGSEPVRSVTLDRFAAAFQSCGFRRESFFPCYGLAEATLFVSGEKLPPENQGPDVSLGPASPLATPSVPCGQAADGHDIRIVDPETRRPCPERQAGEIWVAGPSVALGYWNRPEDSERLFRAALAGTSLDPESQALANPLCTSSAACLRTGDVGFLDGGRLHVTGRIKDLIIIRGRNIHPEDVEHVLSEAAAPLQPGGCAAFALDDGAEERLAVVAELRREAVRGGGFEAIFAELRRLLAEALEVSAAELILVPPGGVPKTTSGKVRRNACKQSLLDGELTVLARTAACDGLPEEGSGAHGPTAEPPPRETLANLDPGQNRPLVGRFLREWLAKLSRTDPAHCSEAVPLRSLGLDSLKTVELKHALESGLGLDAPLSLLLSDCSLGELEEALSHRTHGVTPADSPPLPPTSQTQGPAFGLSRTQHAIWAVQARDPDSPIYNLQMALRIYGELDARAFGRAYGALLERHEILRTVYRSDTDATVQAVVSPAVPTESWCLVDATGWTDAMLREDLERRALAPFDLTSGPVARATLYRHGPSNNSLLLSVHHIAVDLWTVQILLEELLALYSSGPAALQEPAVPYREFVRWQQAYLDSEAGGRDFAYWRNRLAGTLPVLALPTDFARPKVPDFRGASVGLRIEPDLAERLRALAERQGTTLFAVMLTAYKVLLHRYSQQEEIIVGTAGSGRSRRRFSRLAGNCVNPLPLRTWPTLQHRFVDYLKEVNAALLEALDHQDLPFSLLVERLQPERVAGLWPIFQALFVFRGERSGAGRDLASLTLGKPGTKVRWGDWILEPIELAEQGETFDLALTMAEYDGGLLATFNYRHDLFAPDTLARMAQRFQNLLEGIVAAPAARLGGLPLLSDEESRRLLIDWAAPAYEGRGAGDPCEADNPCLHWRFERQAERRPKSPALAWGDATLSYGELNRRAEVLADCLRTHGVGPEVLVGLCAERSPALVVGILAILKAGGAYVPLDPAYPPERLAYLLADSGAPLVLVQSSIQEHLPTLDAKVISLDTDGAVAAAARSADAGFPAPPLDPDHPAYVIYTSGSTGHPKGVVVSHRNAAHSTAARFRYYPEPVGCFLLLSSFAFDSSVAGIFWTLSQGGYLVLPPENAQKDPARLGTLIERWHVTHLLCLPSLYGLMLEQVGSRLAGLRAVIVAGESCSPELAARHLARGTATRLHNEYGPTEVTVWSSVHEITAADLAVDRPIPIGRPLPGTRLYLLDPALNPVPQGVVGEVCLGGVGLTRGYLGRPDLTAERFVPDPFAGLLDEAGRRATDTPLAPRLYKTGDLARWRPDGVLEFLGRTDHQVKLRGHRIEPGEIESHLRRQPGVREAVVVVREDVPGDRRLVAYVVPNLLEPLVADALRLTLKEQLPEYMVPSAVVSLDRLPLTPNGKLDHKALPAPRVALSAAPPLDFPLTPVEAALARLWAEVLGLDRVGPHDNFFDLGGHSLTAIQAVARVQEAFGVEISVAELFEAPTVAGLAQVLARQGVIASGPDSDSDPLEALLRDLEQLPESEAERLLQDLAL